MINYNIVLGDDHRIVREGLKQVLADAPDLHVVAEATTGPEVLEVLERLLCASDAPSAAGSSGVAVVLLDIALPLRDGMDVLQDIKKRWSALPVLMLSTYPERQYAVRCIKLGASGYLNKAADPDAMIAAVRKVAMGGMYVSEQTAEALASAVAKTGSLGTEALSHREYQVFKLLTEGKSVSEIGAQLKLASNTVSTYRQRILEKTGSKNDVELALYAQRYAKTSIL